MPGLPCGWPSSYPGSATRLHERDPGDGPAGAPVLAGDRGADAPGHEGWLERLGGREAGAAAQQANGGTRRSRAVGSTADDDPTPWPLLPAPGQGGDAQAEPVAEQAASNPDQPRPWYSVVLGALPARQALQRLDATFSDAADEDETHRRTQGYVIAATLVLDEWGVLVPDTVALASFGWALGHLLGGGPVAALADWDDREQDLKLRFGSILAPTGADGRPRSLTWRDLWAASRALASEFRIPDDLWLVAPCAVLITQKQPPQADILSSFLLPDLGRVTRAVDSLPETAAAYLGLRPPDQPWDALTDRRQLSGLLQPACSPWAAGRGQACTP